MKNRMYRYALKRFITLDVMVGTGGKGTNKLPLYNNIVMAFFIVMNKRGNNTFLSVESSFNL